MDSPTRSRRVSVRVALTLVVLAMVAMWVWIYLFAPRDNPDRPREQGIRLLGRGRLPAAADRDQRVAHRPRCSHRGRTHRTDNRGHGADRDDGHGPAGGCRRARDRQPRSADSRGVVRRLGGIPPGSSASRVQTGEPRGVRGGFGPPVHSHRAGRGRHLHPSHRRPGQRERHGELPHTPLDL